MVPAQSGTYRGQCGPRLIELSWASVTSFALITVLPEYPPYQPRCVWGARPLTDAYEDHEPLSRAPRSICGCCTMTPLTISLGCCLFRAICEVMKGGTEICSVMAKKSACCLDLAACLVPRTWDRDLQF